MDLGRMMQESSRADLNAFLTRMLEAFKANVQILERRLEEEQKFTGNAVREMDAQLNLHNRRIDRLEAIEKKYIDEEQKRVESERRKDPRPDRETDPDVYPTC